MYVGSAYICLQAPEIRLFLYTQAYVLRTYFQYTCTYALGTYVKYHTYPLRMNPYNVLRTYIKYHTYPVRTRTTCCARFFFEHRGDARSTYVQYHTVRSGTYVPPCCVSSCHAQILRGMRAKIKEKCAMYLLYHTVPSRYCIPPPPVLPYCTS